MARKRKAALPRVTVLAMSRRELLAFVQSVEDLRHVAAQLAELADELRTTARRPRRKAPPATSIPDDELVSIEDIDRAVNGT